VADALLLAGTELPPGLLSAHVAVRLGEVESGVRDGFLAGLRAAFTLLPLAVALLCLSSKLTWLALAVAAPLAVGTALARKKWKGLRTHALLLRERLHQQLEELVAHMDVWRAYGAERRVSGAIDALGESSAVATSRADGLRALLSGLNEFLAAAALLFAVMAARSISPMGEARLIAFCAVVFMAYRPLRDLADARGALERGALAFAEIEQAVAAPARAPAASAPRVAWDRDALDVRRLEVPLAEDRQVAVRHHRLAPISFVARPGEIVAVVGATGAGKTTLLRALLGLEPSARGSIRYGTRELADRGVGPQERPFAWVPQDAPVIAGTLAENVLLAPGAGGRLDSGGDDELVGDLLRRIGAERLARQCGGDPLGALGRPVSGGERKWICLARAIATELPFLLLDEPTAGLDGPAQRQLLTALDALRGERTILLVTHQLEPLEIADQVIRL
jgi:ABC-type transport system involved in cytochrome bd biosynthesis fused ATPase/permease subunit